MAHTLDARARQVRSLASQRAKRAAAIANRTAALQRGVVTCLSVLGATTIFTVLAALSVTPWFLAIICGVALLGVGTMYVRAVIHARELTALDRREILTLEDKLRTLRGERGDRVRSLVNSSDRVAPAHAAPAATSAHAAGPAHAAAPAHKSSERRESTSAPIPTASWTDISLHDDAAPQPASAKETPAPEVASEVLLEPAIAYRGRAASADITSAGTDTSRTWDVVPVPAPTYTLKPRVAMAVSDAAVAELPQASGSASAAASPLRPGQPGDNERLAAAGRAADIDRLAQLRAQADDALAEHLASEEEQLAAVAGFDVEEIVARRMA